MSKNKKITNKIYDKYLLFIIILIKRILIYISVNFSVINKYNLMLNYTLNKIQFI